MEMESKIKPKGIVDKNKQQMNSYHQQHKLRRI